MVNRNLTKKCLICNKDFPINKNESRNFFLEERKYCGHKCFAISNSIKLKGKSNFLLRGLKRSKLNIERVKLTNSGSKSHLWKGGISSNRKEYYRIKCLERYARSKGAKGSFTVAEWENIKAKYNYCCSTCGISEKVKKLTKDHVIPLTKGGSNYINNIKPLCQSCNSRKYNKLLTHL